jgi:hypothetical protein
MLLFATVVSCLVAWYAIVLWFWTARAEEWTRKSDRTQPAQNDRSEARGVYLVHNPKMLRAHGVVVFELGYGLCAVHFGQPGKLLDAGTPQVRELLKAPSGAELVAVPTDSDPDAPWRLDLHVPPCSPWRRSSTEPPGALP